MKAIIEHLEEEMYPWCILEYAHISLRLGRENVIFTNVPDQDREKIEHLGSIESKSILELVDEPEYKNMCLLDPKAERLLGPSDNKFDVFLFGGILGDYPMKGRTELHFKPLILEKRNIGKKQMSTDTAVIVTQKIIDNQEHFKNLEFQDGIEIPIEEGFTEVFPYRYLVEDGKLVFTPGLVEHLKKESSE